MKLRQFLSVLGVVAFVAVIYSPSTIGFSASPGGDGGTGPSDTSSSGTSQFVSYLHQSGYNVTVATDPQRTLSALQGHQRLLYVLIGADSALTTQEVQAFQHGYSAYGFSALVAEGNDTNDRLLSTFGATTTGEAIVDPTSTFQDNRVFTVDLSLPGSSSSSSPTDAVPGLIDIASPLLINGSSSSPLAPVATTSASSYDLGHPTVKGPRTVVAAGTTSRGSRVLVLTDSAPFTNSLFNDSRRVGGVDEKAFVAAMLSYVDPGKATPILLDASHYNPPQPPKSEGALPIGPLAAYAVEQSLSGLNGYYANFPSQVSGFLGGMGINISTGAASALVALIILFSVYGAMTRWFAPEKRGWDDLPPPRVERTIVAESGARLDFLQTSRSKQGYVATLAQLYEVLDSIVLAEFGSGILTVDEGALAARVGIEDASRAKKLFLSLSKFHDYSLGRRKFFLSPVLRWRALTTRMTTDAEAFLNRLGITIAGEDELRGRSVEQIMRKRVAVRASYSPSLGGQG